MITVIRRPLGHKLSTSIYPGVASDSSGDVLITTPTNHGLSDGNYVYVDSNIEYYNGFKYVDSISYTTFKLKESEAGDYVPFKQEVDIDFQISVLDHGWQSVHLPIVYELESDLNPSNIDEEAYTPITVVSFSNNQGYVQLNLSSSLTDPTALTKIKLVGTGDLSGVYQIITVLHPWSVIIDLAYDSTFIFSGYEIVKYYDNYSINVNIYAGLTGGHPWTDEKPLLLAATKKFIPDEDNKVLFLIDEILRGYIETVNNLAKDTLPNNLDFMVEFYIGYYESYDSVSSGEIVLTEGSESIDDFIGNAVNSKNEFKNIYSGFMSEYVGDGTNLAKWLNDFEIPIAIVGYFFDISFINNFNDVDIEVTIEKKLDGDLQATEILTFTNPGKGIIRVPFTPESGYDQYCLTASTPGTTGVTSAITLPSFSSWLNHAGPDLDWTTGASPTINLPGTGLSIKTSDYTYASYAFVAGVIYTIAISYTRTVNSGSSNPRTSTIAILDSGFSPLFNNTRSDASGANSISITFTADSNCIYLAFKHSSGSNVDITLTARSGTQTTPDVDSQTITEEICIAIIEECNSTLIEDIRELETGDFRLLE